MSRTRAARPNPVQWIWYAFGGRLPGRYRDWVLHDVTCRTWALRHVARSLTQLSPGLLILLLPGPLWILVMSLVGGVLMAVWYSIAYMEHTCEYRLSKHGFPPGTGRARRQAANERMHAEQAARYAAIYRDNQDFGDTSTS